MQRVILDLKTPGLQGWKFETVQSVFISNVLLFRALSASWMYFAFISTAAFGGSLRAFLLRPSVEYPMDSLDDLVLYFLILT